MSPEPSHADAQRTLGDYIRDPDRAMAPPGIEERRLKIYRELFFNNVEGLLAGNFPVIKRILTGAPDPGRWSALVRDFYREHPSRTPLFTELARELLRYLETRAAGLCIGQEYSLGRQWPRGVDPVDAQGCDGRS